MRKFIVVAITVLLCACMHPAAREFKAWAEQTKPLAESGQIKWSDFYKQGFKKMAELPEIPGKASAMERTNILISAALAYEGGKLSKEDFEEIQRVAITMAQKEAEMSSAAASAAWGQALKNYGEARYGAAATQQQMIQPPTVSIYQQPKRVQCSTYGNQTNCNEY